MTPYVAFFLSGIIIGVVIGWALFGSSKGDTNQ